MKQRRGTRGQTVGRREIVRIESIAAGGEGVARLSDGRALFVHRTAPGEEVEVEILRSRPRWARGRVVRVLSPSPLRREALCPHYGECGGCTLEHLPYPAQLEAKRAIVTEAMRRIGGVDWDVPAVTPSPKETRYRNRVSFTLRRLRDGRVVAGFHALHDPSRVVDIDGSCLLPEEAIADVWDRIRDVWGEGAERLPAGPSLRLTLRATSAGAVSLVIQGGEEKGEPAELLDRVPGLEAIWHVAEGGDHPELLAGTPDVLESWGDDRFEVGGSAFLQVNRFAAELLEQHVLDVAGEVEGRTVVDAYCGIGVHARRLAGRGAAAVGIELDPVAVEIGRRLAGDHVVFHAARVEDALAGALPANLLIVNPPRAGLAAAVSEIILAAPPRRIIYVSCDPATLARDVARLGSGYEVASVRCFDLFPQTAHVETVLELRLEPVGDAG